MVVEVVEWWVVFVVEGDAQVDAADAADHEVGNGECVFREIFCREGEVLPPAGGMEEKGEEEGDEEIGNAFLPTTLAEMVAELTVTLVVAADAAAELTGACTAAAEVGAWAGAAAAAADEGGEPDEESSLRAAPAAEQTWFAKSRVAFWSVALQSFSIWDLMLSMKSALPQMQV